MHPVVIGTAGHIDHGKTELVRALTGIDTDRLKEDKERGITTDLGYAYLDYADGLRLAFIDVPGHERFIHNMLAGACGIDVVLLVVAADESIKPQTREHASICRLLGVRRGVVALTKCDLVDRETAEVVRLEVQDFLSGDFLEGAQVVPVSARSGEGTEDLKAALRRAAESAPKRDTSRPARLPVDRVFSARGFGTVVTGTLWAGHLVVDQEIEIFPGGGRARVRGLQVHHRAVKEVVAGQRAAINLQGVEHGAVARGSMLLEPETQSSSSCLLARIELDGDLARRKRAIQLSLYHGTLESSARWRWLEEPSEDGGVASGLAALYCQGEVPAVRGDRFVLRRRSPSATVGGGQVLDLFSGSQRKAALAEHARRLAGADPADAVQEDLRWARQPALEEHCLWIASGVARSVFDSALGAAEQGGGVVRAARSLWMNAGRLVELEKRATDLVDRFHARDGLQVGMPLEELKRRLLPGEPRGLSDWLLSRLEQAGSLRIEADRVARAGHRVKLGAVEERVAQVLEEQFREAGLNPPEPQAALAACGAPGPTAEKILHLLLRRGRIVRIRSGRLYHAEAMGKLIELLKCHRQSSQKIDVGQFKELTGTSRKNAIPLLEHLDATRVTRRVGNDRIIL